MEWKGILFWVWLALFLLWGKYAVDRLAEVIVKKYGKTIFRFLAKLSVLPILRFIFVQKKDNKVDNQEKKGDSNEPISPRVFIKPVPDQSINKGEAGKNQ
jgi:dolichyl-phosphate-mannose--protein O-mannosyl transferase